MAEIIWIVSEIKYCNGHSTDNWVHVSPLNGDETSTLTISVDESFSGYSDCSAATVVISASTGDIQEIPVKRCLRECNCDSITIKPYSSSTEEVTECGADGVVFGTYNPNCVCTVNVESVSVVTNVRKTSDGKIIGDVGKNNTESKRTLSCKVFINGFECQTLSRTQHELVYSYSSASSRNETTSVTAEAETSTSFGCSGGAYRAKGTKFFDIITKYECKDSCGQSYHEKDYEQKTGTGSTSLGSTGGTFSNRECNCNTDYTNSMEVQFEADGIYSNVITFTQTCAACPSDPKCCDCSSLTVTGKTNISSDGGSSITIGSFSKTSCMTNPSASSTESWLSNLTISGSDVKATVEANPSTSPRSASVTVKVDKGGGQNCTKTMTVKQSGSSPECYIDGPDEINSCDGVTVQYTINQT